MNEPERDNATLHDLARFRATKGADPTLVPCAQCNALINMHVVRCPHCGIHFDGPAFQFAPHWKQPRRKLPLWMRATMFAALAAAAIALLVQLLT